MLTSRLHNELREKRGLTYSINSNFSSLEGRGPFIISMQTENSQVEKSLELIKEVMGQYFEQGPTDTEIDAAKENVFNLVATAEEMLGPKNSLLTGETGFVGLSPETEEALEEEEEAAAEGAAAESEVMGSPVPSSDDELIYPEEDEYPPFESVAGDKRGIIFKPPKIPKKPQEDLAAQETYHLSK